MLLFLKISFYFILAIIVIAAIHFLFFPPDKEEVARMEAKKPVEIDEPPYWMNLDALRRECIARNPERARAHSYYGDSMYCGVCGVHMGNRPAGMSSSAGTCSDCYYGIFEQCGDIKPEHKDWEKIYGRERLRRMIAVDVSRGIISKAQGAEECRHLEELFDRDAADKERIKADRQRAEEEHENEVAALHQSVNDLLNRW